MSEIERTALRFIHFLYFRSKKEKRNGRGTNDVTSAALDIYILQFL